MPFHPYLTHDSDLQRGSVDDAGGTRYAHLSQNVPDGFVTDLQADLNALGFDAGTPDGAFGKTTRRAVEAFRRAASLPPSGVVDARARTALAAWLAGGHTRTNPPPAAPTAPVESPGVRLVSPRIPHFSQGDPAWASRVLGRNSTIQKSGCAISCVAMVLKFRNRDVDPGVLDDFLDANGGYAGDSVMWGVAGACRGDALAYARLTGSRQQLLAKLHERIDEDRPTLVRVDYGIDAGLTYNHFVLAVGRTAGGDIVMNDPATRFGDGYAAPGPDNVIQTTSRKGGYEIVQLDWYD